MCYLVKDSIFTGDTFFIECAVKCDELGRNTYSMFESIKKLKGLVNSNILVYQGHSYNKEPGCEFNFVLRNNVYCQIDDEEGFVRFRMRKKQRNLFDFK
ncbi:hypothetical protein [Clostridium sp. C8-1-8]|uniref:hypothetical protein n=1 Tax=Clostridium sp. C8-1-8 TaxID=2698831 RepID=UPI001368C1A0|nr:hypothetical protein [Clostridium sp. C8-1-8]